MSSFDRVADVYDATRGLPPGASATITAGLVDALHALSAEPRLLEVGVGTGRIAVPLAAAGVSVVGVDVAPAMLARLRAKKIDLPIVIADALRLPFRATFDAALFVHVLHLVPDAVAALREGLAIVRPGGALLVGHTEQTSGPRGAVWRLIGEGMSEVAGVPPPGDWNAAGRAALRTVADEVGADVTETVLARWEETTTGAAVLEAIAARVYSNTWRIPDAAMPELLRRLTPRLEALLEGLDRRFTNEVAFTLAVARLPAAASASPDAWHDIARALLGEPELTSAEVAREAGVDFEQARRFWRTLGFPPVADDQRVFTRADVQVLAAVRDLMARGIADPAVVMQLGRVLGQSLARVAEAQVAPLRLGDRPALDGTLPAVVPRLERFLAYAWRRHLLAALFRAAAGRTTTGGDRQVVGFVDLVGFTETSEHLSPDEIAGLVERFEAEAYERIPAGGGRIIKTIGDEVMFAVPEPRAAAEMALALVDAYAADALPARIGLAWGPTVPFEGDIFGPTVNLASRLVGLARSGTVLVDEALGGALADDPAFTLRRLLPRLKGLGRVRAWVVRRAARRGSAASAPSGAGRGRSARRAR